MPAEPAVARAVVAFGRALRRSGLPAGVEGELALYQSLAEVDLRRRDQVYWSARACLLHQPGGDPRFEELFTRFWRGLALDRPGRGAEHGESDPRMRGPQHGGEAMPQFRIEGRQGAIVDGQANRGQREIPAAGGDEAGGGRLHGALAAYSPRETLTGGSRLEYGAGELDAVRALAEELRRAAPRRRSRRSEAGRRPGRLDLRRTLRRSIGTLGEPLRPAYAGPSERPRRVLFACDVSGSMDRYSRIVLASLRAAVSANRRTEAFAFATRLTRLTPALSGTDLQRALERSRAEVADWSGGTRIGEVLAAFNRTWGRRGLARGAIVVVVSDGWDRGDPALLARELRRLQLQSRRLIWINPRPGEVGRQPLAVGMRAALPQVDDYVPGHDPRALSGLADLLGGLDGGRPARRAGHLHSASEPPHRGG